MADDIPKDVMEAILKPAREAGWKTMELGADPSGKKVWLLMVPPVSLYRPIRSPSHE